MEKGKLINQIDCFNTEPELIKCVFYEQVGNGFLTT